MFAQRVRIVELDEHLEELLVDCAIDGMQNRALTTLEVVDVQHGVGAHYGAARKRPSNCVITTHRQRAATANNNESNCIRSPHSMAQTSSFGSVIPGEQQSQPRIVS